MSTDGLFTAKKSAIKAPPMKPVVGAIVTTDTQSPLSAEELADLLADDNKLRKLAKGKLVSIIHESSPTPALVAAINALLDRIDGKPMQTQVVAMNVNGTVDHKIMLPATKRWLESIGVNTLIENGKH